MVYCANYVQYTRTTNKAISWDQLFSFFEEMNSNKRKDVDIRKWEIKSIAST
jgi:hypothetical protein